MLAYLLWHRPQPAVAAADYERASEHFHRSLAHAPPTGFRGSALYRVGELPWLEGGGYEDWYLVHDFAALGVLNEAAVAHGHRGAHDDVARRFGGAAGGLYGLLEGCAWPSGEVSAATPASSRSGGEAPAPAPAIWISRPPGAGRRGLAELLGDGMDPARSGLWRRSLVLGPAPEYCVIASEPPAGVAATRLPAGWQAVSAAREVLWRGEPR